MRYVLGLILVLCVCVASAPAVVRAETLEEQRAQLEAQLAQLESQIEKNKSDLTVTQAQRASFEREVAIVTKKIKDAELSIKARDLSIKKILGDVSQKQKGIQTLDARVAAGRRSIAQMIRKTHEIDETSLVALALGSDLPHLLDDIEAFATVERALGQTFETLAVEREDLAKRKESLLEQQQEEEDLRKLQLLQRSSLKNLQSEKSTLVAAVKGQESRIKKTIADDEKSAAQIRARLFGLRDTASIQFGKAYEYAKDASQGTGVRPALILAILTQETNLGENIGSCYVKDSQTGAGIGKNTGRTFSRVMKAPRDTEPFLEIARTLGIDWQTTPVSCPQASGYGGAMGPSQFIPSTWMLYKPQLERLTGGGFPDPWNARTAIFATALLMQDNGAAEGTWAAERRAALRYFAGGNWSKPANAFYGDSVMELVAKIQKDVDTLER